MIHCYRQNGLNIVLDTASGSVHCVDDIAFDAIQIYDNCGRERTISLLSEKYAELTDTGVLELITEIEELKNRGKLYSEDTWEQFSAKARGTTLKALCLNVSHMCNMSCGYCFAGKGEYSGKAKLMPLETGMRALDFLAANSGDHKNLYIDFFGGEPLLNWDVVRGVVRYGREIERRGSKRFLFTLTTNGLLIDDGVIEFVNREMSNVVLSLDGRREVNDASRKLPDGSGTYEAVLPGFRRLVQARGGRNYYIRGTYTNRNIDFTEDILHLADLGFTELSMEPVVPAPMRTSADNAEDEPSYRLTAEHLPEINRQYELLAAEMLERKKEGRGFTFYHFMLDLKSGPCLYKRLAGCGVGTEYLAVTPDGELYPCHQFVGNQEFLMGDIFSGISNISLQDEFRRCTVYARAECLGCWARMYCSGGCAAGAYNSSGSIAGVYGFGCEVFKKRIECAIMMKAAEASSNNISTEG